MILKDFYTGGFPIRNTAPVLCFTKTGEVFAAYDTSSLSSIISTKEISQIVGVWPGKKNTDCFILSKEHYGNIKPPPGHEPIDQAKSIVVVYDKEVFVKVVYKVEEELISSTDKDLLNYIVTSGLQHKTIDQGLIKE